MVGVKVAVWSNKSRTGMWSKNVFLDTRHRPQANGKEKADLYFSLLSNIAIVFLDMRLCWRIK